MKKYKMTGIEKCLTECVSSDPTRMHMSFLSLQHGMVWGCDGTRLFGTRSLGKFSDYSGSDKLFYPEPLKTNGCLTQVIDGEKYKYPDLNCVIPKAISEYKTFNFKLPKFIGDLKNKKEGLDAVMTFDFSNGNILLGYGDNESDTQVAINARLLAPFVGLDLQDAYTIKFWFSGETKPILLTPHDATPEDFLTKDWIGIVMPLRREKATAAKKAG